MTLRSHRFKYSTRCQRRQTLAAAGLTARPGAKIPCPWIAESPAAFECRQHTTLGIGNSREIILGEVIFAHFAANAVDPANHHVDPAALDAIGRMGGHSYSSTRDRFDLPSMSVDDWRKPGSNKRR